MASYTDLTGSVPGKLSKSRSKTKVKPILKKLSHSEKNSLDLDRSWDEQPSFGNYSGSLGREREGSFGGRDVSFSISATELNSNGRSKFSHARSTSGTSHISIATSGSGHGHRNGSFVHPFQQTPRTLTPPLSYANSFTSFDQASASASASASVAVNPSSGPRDYSPTITEDDNDLLEQQYHAHRPSYHPTPSTNTIVTNPTSYPRRPSLASRTSSLSDIHTTGPPSLRLNTTRTNSNATSSRLVHVSSHSDINIPGRKSESAAIAPSTVPITSPLSTASPSTSVTAMSPLRTSLEGFRLRSRSEIDSYYHQERIREERRRWEEKETAKEAKRAREDMRKRERANTKDAERIMKEQQRLYQEHQNQKSSSRKKSFSNSAHSARNSSSDLIRPSVSRKKTAPDAEKLAMGELGFASRNYENTDEGEAPVADEGTFEGPRRCLTAKRKTQSAWTSFVLWFRTRVLRLNNMATKR